MKTLTREICRIEIDPSQGQLNIRDKITNSTPDINRAVDMVFQIGFVWNGVEMVDVSDFESIRIEVKESRDPSVAAVMAKTILAADFSGNASITKEQWDAGTHQHAEVDFSKSETALNLAGGSEKSFWLIVKATTSAATGSNEFILGTQQIAVKETGYNSGVLPRVAGNLVPSGAVYNGSGNYVITGLTVGRVYKWTAGVSGFDAGLINGSEYIYDSGKNFTAQATSVTLEGEGGKAVGAAVWESVFLPVEESDARYGAVTSNFIVTGPTFPGWDVWVTNGSRRAIVNVSVNLFTSGASGAGVTLIVEDYSGTWSHYEYANGQDELTDDYETRLLCFPVSPGAKWKIQNTTDHDGVNQINSVRVSEF